jgi:hypothetical protein
MWETVAERRACSLKARQQLPPSICRKGLNQPIKVEPSQAVSPVELQNIAEPSGIQQITPVQPSHCTIGEPSLIKVNQG